MAHKPLEKKIRYQAYKLVLWQLVGVLFIASLALLISGWKNGWSVLAGGLCYGLPNLFFVWRVFRYAGASQMNQFVVAFFFGEMLKLIMSGILFLIIVKYCPVSLLSVLVGFVGAIASFWVVCVWHFSRK